MIGKMRSVILLGEHAMRRFRFHLGTLLLIVLVVGIGFAAHREPSESWVGSLFSVTICVLLISLVLAWQSRGSPWCQRSNRG
jgi:glucose uptake protein GlcU